MRRRILAFLLVCATSAWAAQTTFRANLRDIIGPKPGMQVVLSLVGCSTYVAADGTHTYIPTSVTLYPDAAGNISKSVPDQASVACQGGTGTVYYHVTLKYKDARGNLVTGPQGDYDVTGSYFDLSTAHTRTAVPTDWEMDAVKIQHVPVDSAAPANGQALVFDSASGKYKPGTVASSGGGTTAGVTSWNGQTGDIAYIPDWASVTGKPASYPSDWNFLANIPATMPSTWATVSGKPTTFASDWSIVANIPASFPPVAPTASTMGGVKSFSCTGTDKVISIGTDGTVACGPDQTTTGGTGITNINGAVGSTQTFGVPDTTGTAPTWTTNTGTNVHTLHIPMAATAGTTAGLVSKAQYDLLTTPAWDNITGKPATIASDWASLANKPATFPPSLPTTSVPGGVFLAVNCTAGNHVSGINVATGSLTCAADAPAWTNITGAPASFPTDWSLITSKPTSFAPAAHTHAGTDIASGTVPTARLGSGSATASTFLAGDSAWKAVDWSMLSGKPATFAPSSHNHVESDVVNLVSDLSAKANTASPNFTGNPTAPTPATNDNSSSIPTTAWFRAQTSNEGATYTGNKTISGDFHVTGNATIDGYLNVAGPWQVVSDIPATAMTPTLGRTTVGIDNDSKFKVSENGGAVTELAKKGAIDGTDITSGTVPSARLPKPTTSLIGGIYQTADCSTGQHVNGIDLATGALKCTADAGGGGYSNLKQTPDANTISQSNGSTPQARYQYETVDNVDVPVNYSRFGVIFNGSSQWAIGSMAAGTGTVRPLAFMVGNSTRWLMNTGYHFVPNVNNAYDVGSSTYNVRSLYLGTSVILGGTTHTSLADLGANIFIGKQTFVAGTTGAASLNIPSGVAPTAPVAGDFWNAGGLPSFNTGSGNKVLAFTDSNITGNSATATALAANPPNCPAGQAAMGIAADGTAEGCFSPSGGTSHALLSSTHTDTTAGSPNQGEIITAQGTSPATWTQLPRGAAYQVLTMGTTGTDPQWGGVALGSGAGVSGTLPTTRGGTGVSGSATYPSAGTVMITTTGVTAGQMPALTGDVTTSAGAVATTMAAKYKVRACELHIWGTGTAGALQTTDSEAFSCFNAYGSAWSITAIYCLADNSSSTTTVTPTITGGAAMVSPAIPCGNGTFASGTLSGSPSIASLGSLAANITVAGTAKSVRIVVVGTI